MYDIVNGEEVERERAVLGNFKLALALQHHGTDIDRWANISQEQRNKRMKIFQSDKVEELFLRDVRCICDASFIERGHKIYWSEQ